MRRKRSGLSQGTQRTCLRWAPISTRGRRSGTRRSGLHTEPTRHARAASRQAGRQARRLSRAVTLSRSSSWLCVFESSDVTCAKGRSRPMERSVSSSVSHSCAARTHTRTRAQCGRQMAQRQRGTERWSSYPAPPLRSAARTRCSLSRSAACCWAARAELRGPHRQRAPAHRLPLQLIRKRIPGVCLSAFVRIDARACVRVSYCIREGGLQHFSGGTVSERPVATPLDEQKVAQR